MCSTDPHDQHYRDLDFLDRLHVVACLLHPFHDAAKGGAAFDALAPERASNNVTEDGFRFLARIIPAVDDAIAAREGLREYPLDALAVLVPLRWTLYSLSEAWHDRGDPDFRLPDDPGEVLDFCFMAVRGAVHEFRGEALRRYAEQTKEPEAAAHV